MSRKRSVGGEHFTMLEASKMGVKIKEHKVSISPLKVVVVYVNVSGTSKYLQVENQASENHTNKILLQGMCRLTDAHYDTVYLADFIYVPKQSNATV